MTEGIYILKVLSLGAGLMTLFSLLYACPIYRAFHQLFKRQKEL